MSDSYYNIFSDIIAGVPIMPFTNVFFFLYLLICLRIILSPRIVNR